MRLLMFFSLIIFITIIFIGCAVSYKPIDPSLINYSVKDLQDGIEFSYKYDILRESGNRKYANKANKKGIKLVAVKLTNNTDTTISIGHDIAFFFDQEQIIPMEPITIKNTIKQSTPLFLLYLLLTPLDIFIMSGNNSIENYPIGLILGPGIALGNIVTAGASNINLKNELIKYNILNRDINKGEVVYGIVGFQDIDFIPIAVKLIKN